MQTLFRTGGNTGKIKIAGPFLAGNCAEKPILQVPIWRGAARISAETEGTSQKKGR